MDQLILTQWLTAIGTVGTVIVALLARPIMRRINRPKIDLSVTAKTPCLEFKEFESSSSENERSLLMRVKVQNNGKDYARNVSIFVDSYYTKCEDGQYVLNEFAPLKLKEYSNLTPDIIAPNLLYHFNLASVHRLDDKTTDNGLNKAKVFYKLFLLGSEEDKQLGKGTFIIPLKFYSSDIKPLTFYVEVSWTSDSFSKDKQHYGFRYVSNAEFKSCKIK